MSDAPVVEVRIAAGHWRKQAPGVAALVRSSASAAWRAGGGRGAIEIGVLLADDATLRELNARHRGRDSATNVLSFPAEPADDAPGPAMLGDVALAFEMIAAEAGAQGKPLADHIRHMIVHGVLHLLGYDHVDDAAAEAMERIEAEVLAEFGVPDPYDPAPALAEP